MKPERLVNVVVRQKDHPYNRDFMFVRDKNRIYYDAYRMKIPLSVLKGMLKVEKAWEEMQRYILLKHRGRFD